MVTKVSLSYRPRNLAKLLRQARSLVPRQQVTKDDAQKHVVQYTDDFEAENVDQVGSNVESNESVDFKPPLPAKSKKLLTKRPNTDDDNDDDDDDIDNVDDVMVKKVSNGGSNGGGGVGGIFKYLLPIKSAGGGGKSRGKSSARNKKCFLNFQLVSKKHGNTLDSCRVLLGL